MLVFWDVSLQVLNHLFTKAFGDLLSRDGFRPFRVDLGCHAHVRTTPHRELLRFSLGDRHDPNPP